MAIDRRHFLAAGALLAALSAARRAPALSAGMAAAPGSGLVEIDTPMPAPEWALLERQVLDANIVACEAFFDRYFDARGWLLAVERWGADDGPDDAIENVNDWPLLYALGGAERIRQMVELAYEGHVRQFTAARTREVPLARDGMYFKEFPVMMDWQHNAEGLSVFNVLGLGDPYAKAYRDRVRRFAGFYTGDDPTAPNYDAGQRLIRSMFNGSRGPLLRKATPVDWAGDPMDFSRIPAAVLMHGDSSYQLMLDHFKEYTDTIGDNPLNLGATTLALNAYMLAHEPRYRTWLLEYVDAWIDRAHRNNDLLPTNIGLDGTIGGAVGGKWYGGVYGWDFSPLNPVTGKREDRNRISYCMPAFLNAYLLTGDDKYLDVWRRQADRVNAQQKIVDGKVQTPRMFGAGGWRSYTPGLWDYGAGEIWYLSMKAADRARVPEHPWIQYLEGRNSGYPAEALRAALERIRLRGAELRADRTTPDARFADTMMEQNPASVTALIMLMQGGIHIARPGWARSSPNVGGAPLHVRLRYFDPEARRPGVPPDVAALVQQLAADSTTVTLVNLNPTVARSVTVQGGAYGEHQILSAAVGNQVHAVGQRAFTLRLAPGAGATLTLAMKRFANDPTLAFPWGGPPVDQQPGTTGQGAFE